MHLEKNYKKKKRIIIIKMNQNALNQLKGLIEKYLALEANKQTTTTLQKLQQCLNIITNGLSNLIMIVLGLNFGLSSIKRISQIYGLHLQLPIW
jgi:hypothetical protein